MKLDSGYLGSIPKEERLRDSALGAATPPKDRDVHLRSVQRVVIRDISCCII